MSRPAAKAPIRTNSHAEAPRAFLPALDREVVAAGAGKTVVPEELVMLTEELVLEAVLFSLIELDVETVDDEIELELVPLLLELELVLGLGGADTKNTGVGVMTFVVVGGGEGGGGAEDETAGAPPASRYQFDLGSPKHSPTVTALYPFSFKVSNMNPTKLIAVCSWVSWDNEM